MGLYIGRGHKYGRRLWTVIGYGDELECAYCPGFGTFRVEGRELPVLLFRSNRPTVEFDKSSLRPLFGRLRGGDGILVNSLAVNVACQPSDASLMGFVGALRGHKYRLFEEAAALVWADG